MSNVDESASSPSPVQVDDQEQPRSRVCLISLAGELFAIDLRHVREVFEVESVTRVPGMPSTFVGITNLRGVVVPLVDLRVILGFPTNGASPNYAIVIQHGARQIAVLVDGVPEIHTVASGQFLPMPAGEPETRQPFVTALLRMEDRLGGVVEVPTLLAYVDSGRQGGPAGEHRRSLGAST